jgi:iron complex transport system ATP-binding protein
MTTPLETCDLAIGYPAGGGGKGTEKILAQDLDLSLEPGSFTCLLGPNGCGKSTLLRTLSGLHPPIAGAVRLLEDERILHQPRKRARALALVLTNQASANLLTVFEAVAMGRHPHTNWTGRLSEKDHTRIRWALDAVRIQPLRNRVLGSLSDGERQRAGIARALAQETPLIFLDEPTAFLDLPHRIEIAHTLKELAHNHGLTVLMSTHDLELGLQTADAFWLMEPEGYCTSGAPEDLVLSGDIERVFSRGRVFFDPKAGTFASREPVRANAIIQAEPVARYWLANALRRLGIGAVPSDSDGQAETGASPVIVVETVTTDAGTGYRLTQPNGGSECVQSIEALTRLLRRV